jgi:hypothetical protein
MNIVWSSVTYMSWPPAGEWLATGPGAMSGAVTPGLAVTSVVVAGLPVWL